MLISRSAASALRKREILRSVRVLCVRRRAVPRLVRAVVGLRMLGEGGSESRDESK
jgi:hypothetical protein